MKHPIHTPQELAEKLDYNPDTGELTWKRLRDSTRIGQKAKALDVAGYIQVNISGNVYKGHRVAWAIHYGRWPVGMIDHINGQRSDNRIENLELWSTSQPAGQRVEDKIAWAKDLLESYGYRVTHKL
jgi:hypothetical protein